MEIYSFSLINAYENVICEITAILSRPQRVKVMKIAPFRKNVLLQGLVMLITMVSHPWQLCRKDIQVSSRFRHSYWLKWQKILKTCSSVNTFRLRRNRCHFSDDIFKCILLNENVLIVIKISLKFIPMGPNNNIPALVQIMAWRRPGNKPLSEPMMIISLMHICVTRPRWVKTRSKSHYICADKVD